MHNSKLASILYCVRNTYPLDRFDYKNKEFKLRGSNKALERYYWESKNGDWIVISDGKITYYECWITKEEIDDAVCTLKVATAEVEELHEKAMEIARLIQRAGKKAAAPQRILKGLIEEGRGNYKINKDTKKEIKKVLGQQRGYGRTGGDILQTNSLTLRLGLDWWTKESIRNIIKVLEAHKNEGWVG